MEIKNLHIHSSDESAASAANQIKSYANAYFKEKARRLELEMQLLAFKNFAQKARIDFELMRQGIDERWHPVIDNLDRTAETCLNLENELNDEH